jgi:hypothetical protein
VNASAAASPLLFAWDAPQRRRSTLILFLVASAILHAFGFYVFQVVYPPTAALLPAPARLTVISPDDPESLALLRWVEAEDPALASTTLRPSDYQPFTLPKLEHVPWFKSHEPQLRTLPLTETDLSIPSSAAVGRLPRPRLESPLPLITRKTGAIFSNLPAQSTPTFPAFTFHLSRPDAPANARFRIAIDRTGAVRYCFLIDSSGDTALDEQARQFLLLCRFPSRTETGPLWSIATILWGNDFAPLASPTPAP